MHFNSRGGFKSEENGHGHYQGLAKQMNSFPNANLNTRCNVCYSSTDDVSLRVVPQYEPMVSQTPHPFNKLKRLNRFTHGHFGMETCHQNTSADLQAQLNYRQIMQQVLHCKREFCASNEQVEGVLPFKIIHRLLLDLCCLVFPKDLLDESRVWV